MGETNKKDALTSDAEGSWPMVPLGEVLEKVSTGFATGKRDPKGIVQLRMNNVSTLGQFDWSVVTRVPESEIGKAQFLEAGDVLFNNTNSTELVGKSALFLGHPEPVVYSNHFTRLRVKEGKLLPNYLALWLQMQWQNRVFADICNQWIGQSAVQPTKLTALQISLPPLAEQQQVADELQAQLKAVEDSRAAVEAQLETLRILPAALLRAAFSTPLTKASNVTPPPGIIQFLPIQDWPYVLLGEVCAINPRRTSKLERAAETSTTFVPMPAVDDRNGIIARPEVKPFREVRKGYTYFEEGDVLFAKITPCMQNGKHAIARNLLDGIGFGSTEFHVLRPGERVTAEWVHYFLRQESVLEGAAANFEGSVGQQRVPADYLGALQIPLPPIAEQQRLTAMLQEQLEALDEALQAAEETLAPTKQLRAALLSNMFGMDMAQPIRKAKLRDVCEMDRVAIESSSEEGKILPYLGMEHIESHTGRITRTEQSSATGLCFAFDQRHVLYGKLRPYLNKVATPDFKGRCSTELIPLLPKPGTDRDFLALLLRRPEMVEAMMREKTGARMPRADVNKLLDMPVELPSLQEQQRFVAHLNQKLVAVEEARTAAETQLVTLRTLPGALLRQLFAPALASA